MDCLEGKEKPRAGAQGQVSYLDELKQGNDDPQYKGALPKSLSLDQWEGRVKYSRHCIHH